MNGVDSLELVFAVCAGCGVLVLLCSMVSSIVPWFFVLRFTFLRVVDYTARLSICFMSSRNGWALWYCVCIPFISFSS